METWADAGSKMNAEWKKENLQRVKNEGQKVKNFEVWPRWCLEKFFKITLEFEVVGMWIFFLKTLKRCQECGNEQMWSKVSWHDTNP